MMDGWMGPLAVALLVVFILVRRGRRLFGRQRFSATALGLRLGVVVVLCLMLILVLSLVRGWAPFVGLAIGAAVGLLGVALTRFDAGPDELYYTPNSYVGLAVLLLLVGRLVYRLAGTWIAGAPPDSNRLWASPTTVAVLFVVLGFYVVYNALVLVRGLKLKETH